MERKSLRRFLLLTTPVPLALLAVYMASQGQIKGSGIIILGLLLVQLELIAVFLYRCVRVYQSRRNKS